MPLKIQKYLIIIISVAKISEMQMQMQMHAKTKVLYRVKYVRKTTMYRGRYRHIIHLIS